MFPARVCLCVVFCVISRGCPRSILNFVGRILFETLNFGVLRCLPDTLSYEILWVSRWMFSIGRWLDKYLPTNWETQNIWFGTFIQTFIQRTFLLSFPTLCTQDCDANRSGKVTCSAQGAKVHGHCVGIIDICQFQLVTTRLKETKYCSNKDVFNTRILTAIHQPMSLFVEKCGSGKTSGELSC